MKTVYTANKNSYGCEFTQIFSSLQKLKQGIVSHEFNCDRSYNKNMYTEDLFNDCKSDYSLFQIELDDSEEICFSQYDGQSSFRIEKKEENIISTKKCVD